MRTPRRLLTSVAAATIAALAFMAVRGRAQAPTGPVTGNPVGGKKLYESYTCYACHGFNGDTGARSLVPGRSPYLASESTFIAFLRARANLAPTQPSTNMPNYSAATLPDAQAKDIYAYIRTFKDSAPGVDDNPVFKQILSAAQKPYKP